MESFLIARFGPQVTPLILAYLQAPKVHHFIQLQSFAQRILAISYLPNELLPLTVVRLHMDDEDEINLDGFYNLLRDPFRTLEPAKYEKWKNNPQFSGLACALLLMALRKALAQKMLTLQARITLLAKGGKQTDQRPLAKYYERLGFRADPDYLQRYSEAIPELMADPSQRGKIISKYNVDLEFGIPMSGSIVEVLAGLEKNCPQKIENSEVTIVNGASNEKFEILKKKIEDGEDEVRRRIFG